MGVICPTCMRPMEAHRAPIESLETAPLTTQQRKIVQALAHAYPRDLSTDYLIDFLYADEWDGGPHDARQVIRAQIVHIRRKLVDFGWTIPKAANGPGVYGRYRLAPMTGDER